MRSEPTSVTEALDGDVAKRGSAATLWSLDETREDWPQTLRLALRTMLATPQPVILLWGPSRLFFHNDAAAALLGDPRHAPAMAKPAAETLGEVWSTMALAVDDAFATGAIARLPSSPAAAPWRRWPACTQVPVNDADAANGVGGVMLLFDDAVRPDGAPPDRDMAAKADAPTQEASAHELRAQGLAAQELAALYAASPVGLAVLDRERRFVRINDRLAEIKGVPASAHVARTVDEVVPDLADAAAILLERVLAGEPVLGIEIKGVTPARPGVVRTWRENWLPLRDASGAVVAAAISAEEVTDQKALAASEERYRLATEAFDGYVYDWDVATGSVERSAGAASMLGFSPDEIEGDTDWWRDRVHPDEVAVCADRVIAVKAGTATRFETQMRVRRKDGAWLWVVDRGTVVRDAEGRPRRVVGTTIDITAAKAAELALKESEGRLRALAGSVPNVLWEGDAEGRNIWISEAWTALTGQSAEEAAGAGWMAAIHPDDAAATMPAWQAALSDGSPFEQRMRVRDRDGDWRWAISRAVPVRDADGAIRSWAGSVNDVHDLVSAQEALRVSQERLQLALEGTNDGLWDWNISTGEVYHSPRFAEQLGYAAHEWESSFANWIAHVHPDDAEPAQRYLKRYFAGELPTYASMFRMRHKDRSWRWILSRARTFRDADGKITRMVGAHTDITAQKEAEAALSQSAARLKLGMEVAALGLGEMDYLAGTITLDARSAELFALPAGVPLPRETVHARFHPDDAAVLLPQIERLVGRHGDDFMAVEHRVVLPDGAVRWLSARKLVVHGYDAAGIRRAVSGLIALHDVTSLKQAEAALRDLNVGLEERIAEALAGRRLWADIVDAADAFIQVVDPELRLVAMNRSNADEWERLYGARPTIGASLPAFKTVDSPDFARATALWRRALAGESFAVTETRGEPGSTARWYEMKFSPLRDGEGRLIGACRISYDVTERVAQQDALAKAQAQLFESQKMETIGQLTGGVAHDFNNLLSAILSNLDIARKRETDLRTASLIDGAIKGAERGAALTKRLLAFARRQDLKAERVDLGALFDEMHELLVRSLGPGVKIVADLPVDLPAVRADLNQLELALLNLAVNARDAMPQGGQLTIAAEAVSIGRDGGVVAPGDYVRLRVADTGQGMDEATLRRAAEPFFTTKGVGKGTGLGLSMVQGLAAQSGGAMTIASARGQGTTVTLLLPQALAGDEAAKRPAPEAASADAAQGALAILVVDDDALVSMGTAAMLEDLGHTVIEANSGRQALEALAKAETVHLVITDHAMPGMTGLELARAIQQSHPGLPIVLATGYAELPSGEDPGLPRLAKPFRQDHLIAVIEALGLSAARGGPATAPEADRS